RCRRAGGNPCSASPRSARHSGATSSGRVPDRRCGRRYRRRRSQTRGRRGQFAWPVKSASCVPGDRVADSDGYVGKAHAIVNAVQRYWLMAVVIAAACSGGSKEIKHGGGTGSGGNVATG